jgi:hypothetical protein
MQSIGRHNVSKSSHGIPIKNPPIRRAFDGRRPRGEFAVPRALQDRLAYTDIQYESFTMKILSAGP